MAAATDRFGSPVEAPGLANWLIAGFMVLAVVAAAGFAAATSFNRSEVVQGSLEPALGDARLVAYRPGQIVQVLARDGDLVGKGQPIIVLVNDGQTEQRRRTGEEIQASLEGQIRALQSQSDALRRGMDAREAAAGIKRKSLRAEEAALKQSHALQVQRVKLARESLEAIQELAEKGVGSPLQVRQRKDTLLAAEQELASLGRQVLQAPLTIASLGAEAQRSRQEDRQQLAQLEEKLAELDERRIGARGEANTLITAPIAGRLTALTAKPGGGVATGQSLATIVPANTHLQGVFWLPSRSIGFVRPRNSVRLKYAAYPYQKFGIANGAVTEVALAPSRPPDQDEKSAGGDPLYRVVVALDRNDIDAYGGRWPLTAGMAVEGEIILERQSLLGWLFDNFRSMGKSK